MWEVYLLSGVISVNHLSVSAFLSEGQLSRTSCPLQHHLLTNEQNNAQTSAQSWFSSTCNADRLRVILYIITDINYCLRHPARKNGFIWWWWTLLALDSTFRLKKKKELKKFFVKWNSPFQVIVKMIQSGQTSKKRQMVIKSLAREESLASDNIFCFIQQVSVCGFPLNSLNQSFNSQGAVANHLNWQVEKPMTKKHFNWAVVKNAFILLY